MDILQTLVEYKRLGIEEQIDYKKFYLYSLVASSVSLSLDSEYENYFIGQYEEIKQNANRREHVYDARTDC